MPGTSSYKTMHRRLARERGKATEFTCIDCAKPAHEWSFNNVGQRSNVDHYDPRCRPCHRRFDRPAPICIIDGCERPNKGRGLCRLHYSRWFRLGRTDLPPARTCNECERKHYAKGLCRMHYVRQQRRQLRERNA